MSIELIYGDKAVELDSSKTNNVSKPEYKNFTSTESLFFALTELLSCAEVLDRDVYEKAKNLSIETLIFPENEDLVKEVYEMGSILRDELEAI